MTQQSHLANLPVIDLSLADGGTEERALLHSALREAATGVGFFQLTGHGITPAETAALLEEIACGLA